MFLAAPLVLLFLFTYYPVVNMFWYSLTSWDGLDKTKEFVGLDNYVAVFTRPDIFKVFFVSLFYLGGSVVQMALALYFATILSFSTRFKSFFKGIIPYLDSNEASLVWMHRADWRYELPLTAIAPVDDERVDLVFDGLDTIATIELDGSRVGQTANQHRSYRFDIRDLVGTGEHALAVHFRSALEYAETERERLGRRPSAYEHPLNMVRKMACSFGWDWGPDLQTAGIWKPVRLERWRTARLAEARPLVTVEADGTGRVAVHVDVERAGLMDDDDVPLVVRAYLGGGDTSTRAGTARALVAQAVIPPRSNHRRRPPRARARPAVVARRPRRAAPRRPRRDA